MLFDPKKQTKQKDEKELKYFHQLTIKVIIFGLIEDCKKLNNIFKHTLVKLCNFDENKEYCKKMTLEFFLSNFIFVLVKK